MTRPALRRIPRQSTTRNLPYLLNCHLYSTQYHHHNPRLNKPIDYQTHPLLSHTPNTTLSNPELPPSIRSSHASIDAHTPSSNSSSSSSGLPSGPTKPQNLYQAINAALDIALTRHPSLLIFGEDVSFGGVFRCTTNLASTFGHDRVFNTPLCEQGILGFAIGAAAQGSLAVAEIQFADYVYPAFDQLVNEAAKFRYRDGKCGRNVGGLTVRMPCGAVGHGGLYHSQSPEALFTHVPGLKVVMPRGPIQAKGLLLASIEANDPVVFMEPKMLYRAAVEHVPTSYYTLPLSKAEIVKPGKDVTIVSYGQPLYLCYAAAGALEKEMGSTGDGGSVEIIDLRTMYPWDRETVLESVRRTGRCVIVHEAMVNAGVGAEVAATIQGDEETFLRLEAPVKRVAGWSIHSPLLFERFNVPDVARIYDALKNVLEY